MYSNSALAPTGTVVVTDDTPAGALAVSGGVTSLKGAHVGCVAHPDAGVLFHQGTVMNRYSEDTHPCQMYDETFTHHLATVDIKFVRVGSLVCATGPYFSFVVGAAAAPTKLMSRPGEIPAIFRPTQNKCAMAIATQSGSVLSGRSAVCILADGTFYFMKSFSDPQFDAGPCSIGYNSGPYVFGFSLNYAI
jgi:hypothetical protein